jgi:hypothetical protein
VTVPLPCHRRNSSRRRTELACTHQSLRHAAISSEDGSSCRGDNVSLVRILQREPSDPTPRVDQCAHL